MQKIMKKPVQDLKFQELLSMLPPLDLAQGPWIAGGAARRLWLGEDWQQADLDMFFVDDVSRHLWYKQLLNKWQDVSHDTAEIATVVDSFASLQLCLFKEYRPLRKDPNFCYLENVIETDNAITKRLYWKKDGPEQTVNLQVIKARYSPNVLELWKDFDFTVSCFAADRENIWALEQSVADALTKTLAVNNPLKRDNFAMRVVKHYVYGFDVPDHMLLDAADLITKGEFDWNQNY